MSLKFSKLPALLKKRDSFIPLLLFLVFLGVFLNGKQALAAVGFFNKNNQTDLRTYAGSNNGAYQTLGSPSGNFTIGHDGAGNTYFEIKVKEVNGSTEYLTMEIWKDGSYLNYNTSGNCGSIAPYFNGILKIPTSCYFDQSAPAFYLKNYQFETGHIYAFRIQFQTTNWQTYGSIADTYANGSCLDFDYSHCAPLADIYFAIGLPPTDSLAINFPANLETTTDFEAFDEVYQLANPENYSLILASVCYGFDQTAIGNCHPTSTESGLQLIMDDTGFLDIESELNFFILKTINLSPDTYYAKSFITGYDNSNNYLGIIKSSPEIAFDIIAGNVYFNYTASSTPFYTPTATTTVSESNITCDPKSGFFSSSLCYVFQYLFVPSQTSLNRFGEIKQLMENKPPLGYFILAKNALSGITTSTPPFTLAQASAINNTIFNPLKVGLSFILYLLFGMWLFKRIAHLEL